MTMKLYNFCFLLTNPVCLTVMVEFMYFQEKLLNVVCKVTARCLFQNQQEGLQI